MNTRTKRRWQHFRWRWFTSGRRKRVDANMRRIQDYYHHYW